MLRNLCPLKAVGMKTYIKKAAIHMGTRHSYEYCTHQSRCLQGELYMLYLNSTPNLLTSSCLICSCIAFASSFVSVFSKLL